MDLITELRGMSAAPRTTPLDSDRAEDLDGSQNMSTNSTRSKQQQVWGVISAIVSLFSLLRQHGLLFFDTFRFVLGACWYFCFDQIQKVKVWFRTISRIIGAKWKQSWIVRSMEAALPGWELGVVGAVGVAAFTLSLNLWFLVAISTKHKPRSNGLGTLDEGDCQKLDSVNKVLHGVINILSTVRSTSACLYLLSIISLIFLDPHSPVQFLHAIVGFPLKSRC
jgi:hypothetical protein